eukprot:c10209_g1_i1.p1 GENE.c10209_g1_i1~~c10209_g1_i1.p1  ORF type:complete len:496 (-),score=154.44 c10209_g1_i1:207-1484(-)
MGDFEDPTNIRRHFGGQKLGDLQLPSIGRIVTISSNLSIRAASQVLTDHRIQSAPISNDAVDPSQWWERYYGVLDMFQLMEFALGEAQKAFFEGGDQPTFEKVIRAAFDHSTVAQLRSMDDYSTLRNLPAEATVLDAMELVAKFDAKRIAIVSSSTFINFLTASTILEQIFVPATTTDDVLTKDLKRCLNTVQVADLHLDVPGMFGVLSVVDTIPVLDAFVTLHTSNVRGIAVVDVNGSLVGNLSCSDIQFLINHPDMFSEVCINQTSLKDFTILKNQGVSGRKPITCQSSSALGHVIQLMLKNRVHRVYIVNAWNVPTGVVTVRDIIRALIPQVAPVPNVKEKHPIDDNDSDIASTLSHSTFTYPYPHPTQSTNTNTATSITIPVPNITSATAAAMHIHMAQHNKQQQKHVNHLGDDGLGGFRL